MAGADLGYGHRKQRVASFPVIVTIISTRISGYTCPGPPGVLNTASVLYEVREQTFGYCEGFCNPKGISWSLDSAMIMLFE